MKHIIELNTNELQYIRVAVGLLHKTEADKHYNISNRELMTKLTEELNKLTNE